MTKQLPMRSSDFVLIARVGDEHSGANNVPGLAPELIQRLEGYSTAEEHLVIGRLRSCVVGALSNGRCPRNMHDVSRSHSSTEPETFLKW